MNHTKVDDGSEEGFWAVHDAIHRAIVSLVPPALLAIFEAVDAHSWKVRVCEGGEFCKTRWKEMSLV